MVPTTCPPHDTVIAAASTHTLTLGDVLSGVADQNVVKMASFTKGTRVYARRGRKNLYHPATVLDAEVATHPSHGKIFTYTVEYKDGDVESQLSGIYLRRDLATVAKQHGIKIPKKLKPHEKPGRARPNAAMQEQIMASVLSLLQGKTALGGGETDLMNQLANLEAGGRTPDLSGGLSDNESIENVMQILGGDSARRVSYPIEEKGNVCVNVPHRHWGEAARDAAAQAMVRETMSALTTGMTLNIGGQNIRIAVATPGSSGLGLGSLYSTTSGQAPVSRYWGTGTFREELKLNHDELLDVEHDILAQGRAAGFMPLSPGDEEDSAISS